MLRRLRGILRRDGELGFLVWTVWRAFLRSVRRWIRPDFPEGRFGPVYESATSRL